MDFIYLPARNYAFGIPRVHIGTWLMFLLVCHFAYFAAYVMIDKSYIQYIDDPFFCRKQRLSTLQVGCVSSVSVLAIDWFIANLSILIPLIITEMNETFLAFHYMSYTKTFLLYRLVFLVFVLPIAGSSILAVIVLVLVHLAVIAMIGKIIFAISVDIDNSNELVAIQFNFTRALGVETVRVHKSVQGSELTMSTTCSRRVENNREICPICFDTLLILPPSRCLIYSNRVYPRFNLSVNRPRFFGKINLFKTDCNHTFHRNCLMKWISGKPIRVDLSPGSSNPTNRKSNKRDGATCPVCAQAICLKISRNFRNIFQFL